MNKYQKQLLVASPTAAISFLTLYLTYPLMWVGLVMILPFMFSFCWVLGILACMGIESRFGKWLMEDDK